MSKADPEIDRLAQERLAADEKRITGSRRTNVTIGQAWRAFWRYPSPWMIAAFLGAAVAGRVIAGAGSWWELAIPVALVALFPFIEWSIHVAILHWRPRRLGALKIDPLVSRKHREHHSDPRDIPLVFIPWQVVATMLPALAGASWLLAPTTTSALSAMVSIGAVVFGYEWVHYLVHSDYRPRSRWYRTVWRNHRLHHYKNEHYWFAVTMAGTSDRILGTYPDPATVRTSPTVRSLHQAESL